MIAIFYLNARVFVVVGLSLCLQASMFPPIDLFHLLCDNRKELIIMEILAYQICEYH